MGTSLWFVGNVAIKQLPLTENHFNNALGNVLIAVQLGFILGTLFFAFFALADRFSPSKLFLIAALAGAICNLLLIIPHLEFKYLLASRFMVGFFLAGIYPVGMKIASDYYEKGLGNALGYLVGALVLGTALPYLIDTLGFQINATHVISITSILAATGGILVGFLIPDGPFQKRQAAFKISAVPMLFKQKAYRKATLGYLGHMWELYAFWGFLTVYLQHYKQLHSSSFSVGFWTFCVIAIGGIACVCGGYLSQKYGNHKVALISLIVSGVCCFLSFGFSALPTPFFLILVCIWGAFVVADSPQLSSLVAQSSPQNLRGTGLTLATCLGFSLTIISIQLLSVLAQLINIQYIYMILVLGPILGIWNLLKLKTQP